MGQRFIKGPWGTVDMCNVEKALEAEKQPEIISKIRKSISEITLDLENGAINKENKEEYLDRLYEIGEDKTLLSATFSIKRKIRWI